MPPHTRGGRGAGMMLTPQEASAEQGQGKKPQTHGEWVPMPPSPRVGCRGLRPEILTTLPSLTPFTNPVGETWVDPLTFQWCPSWYPPWWLGSPQPWSALLGTSLSQPRMLMKEANDAEYKPLCEASPRACPGPLLSQTCHCLCKRGPRALILGLAPIPQVSRISLPRAWGSV